MIRRRLAIVASHPIQYYSPWFAHLAELCDLEVFYAHRQTPEGQAAAGFGTGFEWDLPLLEGYRSRFLTNVSRNPGLHGFGGCDTPEIGSIVRDGGYDALITIGWNRKSFLQAAIAAWRRGVPVFTRLDSQLRTPRAPWKRAVKWPLYRALLPRAAHYLSPGRRSDEYLRHYGAAPGRIHRVAHMIDTERFAAGAAEARRSGAAAALRAGHGAAPDDTVFLFVGKLIEKKRSRLLLGALEKLVASGRRDIALWLVGSGPLEAELRAMAEARGLPVRFLGFVNQMALPATYAAADCLVLPSNGEETWGLVVNEAMACGIPAVVSEEAGCAPELVEEGVTGWTLDEPSAGHLAACLGLAADRLGDIDRGRLAQLTQAGSYATGAHQLLEAVERVASTPRSGKASPRRTPMTERTAPHLDSPRRHAPLPRR